MRLTRRPPKPVHHGAACPTYKQINLCRLCMLYCRMLDRQSVFACSKFGIQIYFTRCALCVQNGPRSSWTRPSTRGKRAGIHRQTTKGINIHGGRQVLRWGLVQGFLVGSCHGLWRRIAISWRVMVEGLNSRSPVRSKRPVRKIRCQRAGRCSEIVLFTM